MNRSIPTLLKAWIRSNLTGLLLVGPLCSVAQTWVQKGADLNGEGEDDHSGIALSMPDANTVAIGAQSDENGDNAGHVRVYAWNGSAWLQKGTDIDGEEAGDCSYAIAVSMPDPSTVAIGAPNHYPAGQVRVYDWNGLAWVQKGADINGEADGDWSGYGVSMPDPSTVAIGARFNDGSGSGSGHVRIYDWIGSAWVQKGVDIDGEASGNRSGHSVSMADPNTVAIGAPENDGNGWSSGHVRIYTWDGGMWLQKGTDIDGEENADHSGHSVSMPDPNTVAIGAPYNDGTGTGGGHVRVYGWDGSAWAQKGADLDGEGAQDEFGSSVTMPDPNTIAIGAPRNDGNGVNAGYVRIYGWDGIAWAPQGVDIDGEAADNYSGSSVGMPDAFTVAIGAPYNDGDSIDAGHVRVYTLSGLAVPENYFGPDLRLHPNPVQGNVVIELGAVHTGIDVIVRNALGQVLMNETHTSVDRLDLAINGDAGVYSVQLQADDGKRAVLKFVKE